MFCVSKLPCSWNQPGGVIAARAPILLPKMPLLDEALPPRWGNKPGDGGVELGFVPWGRAAGGAGCAGRNLAGKMCLRGKDAPICAVQNCGSIFCLAVHHT